MDTSLPSARMDDDSTPGVSSGAFSSGSATFHVGHNNNNNNSNYRGRGGRAGGRGGYQSRGRGGRFSNNNNNDNNYGNSRYGGRRMEHHGRHQQQQQQHHRGRSSGRGGTSSFVPRNRVVAPSSSSSQEAPQNNAMIEHLSAMFAKLGELVVLSEEQQQSDTTTTITRPDVGKQARELAQVLCSTPDLFLSDATAALVLVQCVATLPLQTCGYVALTAAMEQQQQQLLSDDTTKTTHSFAQQCCQYATSLLVSDLMQLIPSNIISTKTNTEQQQQPQQQDSFTLINELKTHRRKFTHVCMRVKLLLRYLALLSKIGIAQLDTDNQTTTATTTCSSTMMGLLQYLVQMIHTIVDYQKTEQNKTPYVHLCKILMYLVLSTLPYITSNILCCSSNEEKQKVKHSCTTIFQQILTISNNNKALFTSYYKPGKGIYAIFSSKEEYDSLEDNGEDDEDEEEEEEEEDSCSDTLEELVRVISRLQKCNWETSSPMTKTTVGDEDNDDGDASSPTIISCGAPNFSLFTDAPWEGLLPATTTTTEEDNQDGMETSTTTHSFSPIYLTEFTRLVLPSFKKEETVYDNDDDEDEDETFFAVGITKTSATSEKKKKKTHSSSAAEEKQRIVLATTSSSIIGRFPILDDSSEEGQKLFSQTTPSDRFFYSECVREVMFAHVPTIASSGIEYTSMSKEQVASHVMGVSHLFSPIKMNYLLVETLFGLLAQSSSSSSFVESPYYLGRVIVELCKLVPTTFPAALVYGIGLIFGSELSTLTPKVRHIFSKWFAYHWTNTDFQWPYWSHWDKYASPLKRDSSKSLFLRHVFEYCSHTFSSNYIIEKCLPVNSPHSALVAATVSLPSLDTNHTYHNKINEMKEKIIAKEQASDLTEWLCLTIQDGDDDDDDDMNNKELPMWRTKVAIHAIIGGVVLRDDDDDESNDVVSDVVDLLVRYSPVLVSAMEKDNKAAGSKINDGSAQILLEEAFMLCSSNSSLLVTIVFRLLSGALHLVSFTSLMEFIMLQLGCTDNNDALDDNNIANLWDIAIQCLGNKAELGVKNFVPQHLNYNKSQTHCTDDMDDTSGATTTAACEEALVTLNDVSIDIVNSVTYTIQRVLSSADAYNTDHTMSTPMGGTYKVSPRISWLLDGLRAFVLCAQTCTLELDYTRLSVLDEQQHIHISSNVSSINYSIISGEKLAEVGKDIMKARHHRDDDDDVAGTIVSSKDKRSNVRLVHDFIKTLQEGGGVPIA